MHMEDMEDGNSEARSQRSEAGGWRRLEVGTNTGADYRRIKRAALSADSTPFKTVNLVTLRIDQYGII